MPSCEAWCFLPSWQARVHRVLRQPFPDDAVPEVVLKFRRGNRRVPAAAAGASCSQAWEHSFGGVAIGHVDTDCANVIDEFCFIIVAIYFFATRRCV